MPGLIDRNTQVVAFQPRMTLAQFKAILEATGSPAAPSAAKVYAAIATEGVSPAFLLAVFKKESNYATDPASMVVRHDTKNLGNTRSSTTGVTTIIPTERGNFVKYDSWEQGAKDAAHRLVVPGFDYARAGARTIGEIIPIWAPASDSNNPAGYIDTVVSLMNQWLEGRGNSTMNDPIAQVHLIPGHAGRGRGGARPKLIVCHVQEGTNDLYQEFLNRPADNQADCTIWSKQDGTLVRLLNDTDTPWTNGDVVGPDMANPIIAGMVLAGVGNTNAYSYTIEHQGFAASGFSDAQIESTAKICAYWCFINGWQPSRDRIVGHYQVGNHKGCPGPLFPFDKVVARAKEILGGGKVAEVPGQPAYQPIADYVAAHGGEPVFGKPLGGMHGSTPGAIEQEYEFAHLFVDASSNQVIAQMRDRTNPQGFNVGVGILAKAKELGLTMLTNGQFFIPAVNQPGLGKMERAWAQDSKGVTLVIMASEEPELAKPGQDTPWKVEVLEVK